MEFLDIQMEFALSQKCSMAIIGESNYAQKILSHMCCGFPLNGRGIMPHRCVCPPYVKIEQGGFDCKKGNELMCVDPTGFKKGGDITRPLDDPSNMLGANYSLRDTAFIRATNVHVHTDGFDARYTPVTSIAQVKNMVSTFVEKAIRNSCAAYSEGPEKGIFCSMHPKHRTEGGSERSEGSSRFLLSEVLDHCTAAILSFFSQALNFGSSLW